MKLFTKITALLLVLAMMFAFAACGESDSAKDDESKDKTEESSTNTESNEPSDEEKSEEDSSATETAGIVGEWNGTMDMSGIVSMALGAMLGTEVELEFAVEISMEFKEDGKYTMTMDVDSAIAAGEKMLEDLYDIYAQAEENPVDYETFIAQTDMNSFVDSMTQAETTNGTYELDGDELYMDGDTENPLTVDGDTISGEIVGMASFELEKA